MQIGREYKHLKRILNERNSRQGSNQYQDKRASASREAEAPPTRQAAEKIGVGQSTAIRAEKVVDYIDELKEQGETDRADELRQKLNHSVNGVTP